MELDGKLFIRTGELELTLDPKTSEHTEEVISRPASPVAVEQAQDRNTLTYAAYQILTAPDPLEKVII